MATPNETALDRFLATVAEIRTTLAQIGEAAGDHFDVDPEAITWAKAGDAKRTLMGLQDILAIIRGEAR